MMAISLPVSFFGTLYFLSTAMRLPVPGRRTAVSEMAIPRERSLHGSPLVLQRSAGHGTDQLDQELLEVGDACGVERVPAPAGEVDLGVARRQDDEVVDDRLDGGLAAEPGPQWFRLGWRRGHRRGPDHRQDAIEDLPQIRRPLRKGGDELHIFQTLGDLLPEFGPMAEHRLDDHQRGFDKGGSSPPGHPDCRGVPRVLMVWTMARSSRASRSPAQRAIGREAGCRQCQDFQGKDRDRFRDGRVPHCDSPEVIASSRGVPCTSNVPYRCQQFHDPGSSVAGFYSPGMTNTKRKIAWHPPGLVPG